MRHLWLGCLAAALPACSPDPDTVGRPMTATADPNAYLVPDDPCGAGRLRGLDGDQVLFEREGGRMVRLPLSLIRRARLEVEF